MSPDVAEQLAAPPQVSPCPRCGQPQLPSRPHADAAACIGNLRQLLGETNSLLKLREDEVGELRARLDDRYADYEAGWNAAEHGEAKHMGRPVAWLNGWEHYELGEEVERLQLRLATQERAHADANNYTVGISDMPGPLVCFWTAYTVGMLVWLPSMCIAMAAHSIVGRGGNVEWFFMNLAGAVSITALIGMTLWPILVALCEAVEGAGWRMLIVAVGLVITVAAVVRFMS